MFDAIIITKVNEAMKDACISTENRLQRSRQSSPYVNDLPRIVQLSASTAQYHTNTTITPATHHTLNTVTTTHQETSLPLPHRHTIHTTQPHHHNAGLKGYNAPHSNRSMCLGMPCNLWFLTRMCSKANVTVLGSLRRLRTCVIYCLFHQRFSVILKGLAQGDAVVYNFRTRNGVLSGCWKMLPTTARLRRHPERSPNVYLGRKKSLRWRKLPLEEVCGGRSSGLRWKLSWKNFTLGGKFCK